MCRMIAAAGRFDAAAVLAALSEMAANTNRAFDHELRHLGPELRHDSGWGAAWSAPGGLARHRSTRPCFDDPAFDALSETRASLLIAHARRTKVPATIATENTHPFVATFGGTEYAFCHNGEVSERSQLSWDSSLSPLGSIDSEELFLHTITRVDPSRPADSVREALAKISDFTSLNCLLATPGYLVGHSRRAPGSQRPRYYTLWRGRGEGVEVVSSEPVDGLGVDWRPIADGAAIRMAVGGHGS